MLYQRQQTQTKRVSCDGKGSKIRTFLEVIGWLPHTLRSMCRVNLVFLISVQQLVRGNELTIRKTAEM